MSFIYHAVDVLSIHVPYIYTVRRMTHTMT